jgi:hypothetical protein
MTPNLQIEYRPIDALLPYQAAEKPAALARRAAEGMIIRAPRPE